jgi:hypothetical protein
VIAVKNCEYLNACVRFKNILGLPGEVEHIVCVKKRNAFFFKDFPIYLQSV